MGSNRHNDDSSGGISSQDRKKYFWNDREEGRWRGMGMGLGGRGFIGNTDLDEKGVREEAEENIAEYVAGRLIYKLFTRSEIMEGYGRFLRWRNQ